MELLKKLAKIDRLNKKINEQFPQQKWNKEFIEKVKIDFTYNSNRIEGNAINHGQTIQLLKEFVTPQNASIGDCLDIINHKNVLDRVFDEFNQTELSESSIKKMHKDLMKNPDQWTDGIHYDPGKYKIFENFTYRSSGKQHNYVEPKEVHNEISVLIEETNYQINKLKEGNVINHPLSIATDFHYKFLNKIHPFGDGNGRLARILMNLILLKSDFPPIFIKDIKKEIYMNCFEQEELVPGTMLNFMANRLLESLILKKDFLEKRKG